MKNEHVFRGSQLCGRVTYVGNRSQSPLRDARRGYALRDVEDAHLDFRGQPQEHEHLRESGAADARARREFESLYAEAPGYEDVARRLGV